MLVQKIKVRLRYSDSYFILIYSVVFIILYLSK